jgi:hypothetical protein
MKIMTDEFKSNDNPTDAHNDGAQTENQAQGAPGTPLGAFFFHQRRAAEQTIRAINALVPPDFKQYSREARKEFLTSFKVLIDGANEAISRELNKHRKPGEAETGTAGAQGSDGPSTTGKNKVKVEVS